MTGKNTDRKSVRKSSKSTDHDVYSESTYALPENLSCIEVEFPILIERRHLKKVDWKEIVEKNDNHVKELKNYLEKKTGPESQIDVPDSESNYLKNNVMDILIPALEDTLEKAEIWKVFYIEKCFFNGIDHLAQLLWNNNPRCPTRNINNQHLFNMHWVQQSLKESPRPYYPKSWLWPEEYAATIIQKTVRRYFVQRREDVQEMRIFWKKLKIERGTPELSTNPLLARRFAEERNV